MWVALQPASNRGMTERDRGLIIIVIIGLVVIQRVDAGSVGEASAAMTGNASRDLQGTRRHAAAG